MTKLNKCGLLSLKTVFRERQQMYVTVGQDSLVRVRFIFSSVVALRRQQVAPMGLTWGLGTYICSQVKDTSRNPIFQKSECTCFFYSKAPFEEF